MNSVCLRVAVACLVGWAAAGCSASSGSSSGGGTGGSGGGAGAGMGGNGGGTSFTDGGGILAQASFCASYASAFCDRERTCGFLDLAQYPDCTARATALCTGSLSRITAGVRAYDPAVAFACVGQIKNDPCSGGRNLFPSGGLFPYGCLSALGPGAADVGHLCFTSGDCASGYCSGAPACLTCKAFVPTGGACDSTNRCDTATHFCKPAGDGGSQCAAYAGVGEPCVNTATCHPTTTGGCAAGQTDGGLSDGGFRACLALLPDGTACFTDSSCVAKYCNYNSLIPDAGDDVCGYRAIGQSCGGRDDCNVNNFCKGLDDTTMASTVPGICAARIATGSACVSQVEDYYDGCQTRQLCLAGTCRVPGNQLLNDPCNTSSQCLWGLYCKTPDDAGFGACVTRAASGAACSPFSSGPNPLCSLTATCVGPNDGGPGTCIAPSKAGGACGVSNNNCTELLQCTPGGDGGTCTAYSMAGSNCDAGTIVCANGNTALGFCASLDAGTGVALKTCSNLLTVNTACSTGGQCASGRCFTADGGTGSSFNPGTCAASCIP